MQLEHGETQNKATKQVKLEHAPLAPSLPPPCPRLGGVQGHRLPPCSWSTGRGIPGIMLRKGGRPGTTGKANEGAGGRLRHRAGLRASRVTATSCCRPSERRRDVRRNLALCTGLLLRLDGLHLLCEGAFSGSPGPLSPRAGPRPPAPHMRARSEEWQNTRKTGGMADCRRCRHADYRNAVETRESLRFAGTQTKRSSCARRSSETMQGAGASC